MRPLARLLAGGTSGRAGQRKGATIADIFADPGMTSRAGVVVSMDRALTVPAWTRCLEIRSNLFASMGAPRVQRRGAKGWEDAPDHPAQLALMTTAGMYPEAFFQSRASHRISHGRGAAYVHRVGGKPVSLIPLDPTRLSPFRRGGEDLFQYTPETGEARTIPARDVWNWSAPGWDGLSGYSALRMGRESIGSALAGRDHAGSMFRHGAVPGLVFEHPGVLTEDSMRRLKASLDARFSGVDNHFRSILLEEGLKVANAPTMMSAEDAQLIESRAFDSREICTLLGVPAHWCNDTATRTYSSAEQDRQVFLENTAEPDIRTCEASLGYVLLEPEEVLSRSVRIWFDRTALTMADTRSQAEADSKALAGVPWMTRNEVRQRYGLGPIDGGDEVVVPINQQRPSSDPAPADREVARRAAAFEAAVSDAARRMRRRLAAAASGAGKDSARFVSWLEGAREQHEGVVREAFAFADGVADTRSEVDALFAGLRAACDAALDAKPSEFEGRLSAALAAWEAQR